MNDKSEILRIHDEWIGLEKSGKDKDVLRLCHHDVVWLVPGLGMLKGFDEIRAFLDSQPEVTLVSIDSFDVEIEVSCGLAVKRANFCTTFLDKGFEMKVKGAHIWTLRKDSESNQWRVTNVAWSIKDDSS